MVYSYNANLSHPQEKFLQQRGLKGEPFMEKVYLQYDVN